MSINKESSNVPYALGRLFALYEYIQYRANGRTNTTIADNYFTNASSTPALIFPRLGDLAKKHLHKLSPKESKSYTDRIADLMVKIGDRFPLRLSLPEQGAFQLGYYFEKQTSGKDRNKETSQREGEADE